MTLILAERQPECRPHDPHTHRQIPPNGPETAVIVVQAYHRHVPISMGGRATLGPMSWRVHHLRRVGPGGCRVDERPAGALVKSGLPLATLHSVDSPAAGAATGDRR